LLVELREVRALKQFEIWWADLPKPAGRRPVLLLTRDDAYAYLSKFIVAEITTTIRNIPVEVPLGKRDGLPAPCVANFDNLRTVNRDALVERISKLATSRQVEAKHAAGYAFGWDELIDA
jgi:mRNA interferase MazF